MNDKDIMPFGKHKGKELREVPADYLLWWEKQDWAEDKPDLLAYVRSNKRALMQEAQDQKRAK